MFVKVLTFIYLISIYQPMKKLMISTFFAFITSFVVIASQTIASYVFNFNESDFVIKRVQGDSLSISPVNSITTYGSVGAPMIPLLAKRIVLNGDENVIGINYNMCKRILMSNIKLASVQKVVPTNVPLSDVLIKHDKYQEKIYPDTNCVMVGINKFGESKLVDLLVCPYVYDASKNELYFVDSLAVDIAIESGTQSGNVSEIHPNAIELMMASSDNPEELHFNKSMIKPLIEGVVDVTYNTQAETPTLSIVFSDVTTGKQYLYDLTYKSSPARLYISDMLSGIYVVNLVENGKVITSNVRLIKQ